MEKFLFNETRKILPHFLKMADAGSTHELLPILCHLLQTYRDSDELCKALFDSINKLVQSCYDKHLLPDQACHSTSSSPVTSCRQALELLADEIAASVRMHLGFIKIAQIQ